MRLLAATWLIAPTVLSTNAVFAVDNQPIKQSQQVHLLPAQLLAKQRILLQKAQPEQLTHQQNRPNQLIRLIHQKMKSQPRHIPLRLLLL